MEMYSISWGFFERSGNLVRSPLANLPRAVQVDDDAVDKLVDIWLKFAHGLLESQSDQHSVK